MGGRVNIPSDVYSGRVGGTSKYTIGCIFGEGGGRVNIQSDVYSGRVGGQVNVLPCDCVYIYVHIQSEVEIRVYTRRTS